MNSLRKLKPKEFLAKFANKFYVIAQYKIVLCLLLSSYDKVINMSTNPVNNKIVNQLIEDDYLNIICTILGMPFVQQVNAYYI